MNLCEYAFLSQDQPAMWGLGKCIVDAPGNPWAFRKVSSAWPWLGKCPVSMDMEDRTPVLDGKPHGHSDRVAVDPGANAFVHDVVTILDGPVVEPEEYLVPADGQAATKEEPDSLSRERMPALQVGHDSAVKYAWQFDHAVNAPR